jgi:multidrug efflux pump
VRRTLLAALMIVGCGKHGDHVTSAARDLVPITVTTMLPGASPEEMASSVTTPLEHELGQVSHLDGLHSRSTEGRSVIVAEFASGTDIDVASQEVQQALNASLNLLPRELPMPPTYTRKARTGAVLRLTLASQTLPLVEVADVASSVVA